jgi:hypothetical protein
VLRAIHMSGLRGRDAVVHYQVYSNLVLGAAAAQAARLASSDGGSTQQGWIQVYSLIEPTRFPYAEAVKSELRLIDYEELFGRQVTMFLDTLARATEPVPSGHSAAQADTTPEGDLVSPHLPADNADDRRMR